ncbi:hypothetical protein M422DRAFT_264174 [Sphaerobolus stellatus SS14]|uniref:Uncharacterized protein n=1 Tax=Sphaerobolus stellatus (strain SS14) TaxID=990650 RepID=A0A0C9V9D4_SPHS4|nr:hypothetical protein M422DRAFT_264174 [Sphaerobolus stellatus SS14]
MTRVDAYLGNQTVFDETLFQQIYSLSNNPKLVFTSPRILSAYSEAVFPTFSVNGRLNNRQLTIDAARSFFDPQMMPNDFYGQPAPVNFSTIEPLVKEIFNKHPFTPGVNKGTNNFVLMPNTPALGDFCGIYEDIVARIIPIQYPNPTDALRTAINTNQDFLFEAVMLNITVLRSSLMAWIKRT